MCVETITTHRKCARILVHRTICADYIDVTRRQIDRAECKYFKMQHAYSDSRQCLCRDTGKCTRYVKKVGNDPEGYSWSFEKESSVRYNEAGQSEKVETPFERNTRKTKEMKEKIMATRYELEKCEQFIRNACMKINDAANDNSKRRKFGEATEDEDMGVDGALTIKQEKVDSTIQARATPMMTATIRFLKTVLTRSEDHAKKMGWGLPTELEIYTFLPDQKLRDKLEKTWESFYMSAEASFRDRQKKEELEPASTNDLFRERGRRVSKKEELAPASSSDLFRDRELRSKRVRIKVEPVDDVDMGAAVPLPDSDDMVE